MARKRKQTRKKNNDLDNEQSVFWPLAGAIILFALAFLLLLGGFGTGGNLPKSLFHGTYWTFGWASYLLIIACVLWGALKFKSEDHQIPLNKLISMLATLIFASGWLHTAFANLDSSKNYVGGHGGQVGRVVGNAVLTALDKIPASILFFIFALLAFFFSFAISPHILLKLGALFKRRDNDDTDLLALKQKNENSGFKLSEGVPVEHRSQREQDRAGLRQAALKAAADGQQALTTASDPDWKFPSVELLSQKQDKADPGDVEANAGIIKDTFDQFNIDVEIKGANVGPRVTQYTLRPPTGVKLEKLTSLEKNLTLSLAAQSLRIEAPIPGQRAVGVEVPNLHSATVTLHSILTSKQWQGFKGPLSFAIGKDITGDSVVADLEEMPHLLIAGQTKAGKSVMINSLLASFLYRNSPSDLKLILIDPKHVEMAPYDDIPHLITPVITEPEKCISALKWSVAEMERRLKTFAQFKQRDIRGYNDLKKDEGMPRIVIIIDELSDLMMISAREVEALVARIAQKARAAGIHLVLATQRPDANVVTGIIKANVPARMAFSVQDQINSRIVIDSMGAEKLLGKGDMLYKTTDINKPIRIQAPLITGDETNKICDFLRAQRPPQYDDEIISQPVHLNGRGGVVAEVDPSDEPIFREAVQVVIDSNKASTSLLQRKLRIGYGKAARMIEAMQEQGIVSQADGSRAREVLVSDIDEVFGSSAGPGGRTRDVEEDVYDEIPDDEGYHDDGVNTDEK